MAAMHSNPRHVDDRSLEREDARHVLDTKLASARQGKANGDFATYSFDMIITDAEFRLRWIDCAPAGAWHCCAPLQDKLGRPCGDITLEGPGPGKALRNARAARGLDPLTGARS